MRITKLIPTSRIARAAISLAVLASLVAISVIVAGATSGTQGGTSQMDVEEHAAMYGVSLEVAAQHLALHKVAGALEEQLALHEGSVFAGLWVQHEPEFAVIAKFTSDNGDNIVRPYVEGTDLDGLVQTGTAAYAMTDLEQAQSDAKAAGVSAEVETESNINVFENRVELYVLDKPGFEGDLTDREITLPEEVQVFQVPGFSTKETDIYGGLNVTGSNGGCTSGYSVTDNAGTDGITTAGHCGEGSDDNFEYSGDDLNPQYRRVGRWCRY